MPFFQPQELRDSHDRLGRVFADRGFFVAPVPSYYGGFMAFGWATDNAELRGLSRDELARRQGAADISTRYYTPGIHLAAFALPPYVLNMLK